MYRWLLSCSFLLMTVFALAAPPDVFSDELTADRYDCILTLKPAATLAAESAVRVNLEWSSSSTDYVCVTVGKETILIEAFKGGKAAGSWKVDAGVQPGTPYQLGILRRGNWFGLLHDQSLIFHTETPHGAGGKGALTVDAGWTVEEKRVQRLQPVTFADNFMRTSDDRGAWAVQSGSWRLQSAWDEDPHGNTNKFINVKYATNPFAWGGRSPNSSPALCTVGSASWEDYTMTVAIQPSHTGVGVVVNMPDPHHGILVRWSAANDHSDTGNELALFQMDDTKLTPLAKSPGGFVPDQWYKLAVISDQSGIRVLIDDAVRLSLPDAMPWRGGVGLYAEGKTGAVFDDVTVYGHTLNTDLIAENEMVQANERLLADQAESERNKEGVTTQKDWLPFPKVPGESLYQHDCYGDQWISLVLQKSARAGGQLWMGLLNDGKAPGSGYIATITAGADGKTAYSLYRDGVLLTSTKGFPLTPDEDYSLRLRCNAANVWLEVDGERVIGAENSKPPAGKRALYRADGAFANIRNMVVMSRNTYDYTFTTAPVDWVGDGTWMSTERWACSPNWSYLGGWSRGDAVLWHKQRFIGDQSLLAVVAPKMEYPRVREIYDQRYRDYGVTICGDGHDPRSGYAAIYGAADKQGKENKRTVLLRNGVEVASTPVSALTFLQGGHHAWFSLNLIKRGNTIEFRVGGSLLLSYTDPDPIEGGVPGIWTADNGIMISHARISFANAPQPRTEPQVVLGDPWYPDWANVNRPLSLNFTDAWSTSGAPVQLSTVARSVPDGEKAAPTVEGTRVTLTPQQRGEHWYQIRAGDGQHRSADFNLSLPVFDPAQKRDDSHALLLYRFDEGQGTVVHDRSTNGSPLNLTIPAGSSVRWLPGRGLNLRGQTSIRSEAPAKKLMVLADRQSCTIEAWVSTDTLCPPSHWSGCIMSWESAAEQQNFALLHQFLSGGAYFTTLVFAPCTSRLTENNQQALRLQGFPMGLSHIVVTWDGQMTTVYVNGLKIGPVVNYGRDTQEVGYFTNSFGPQAVAWHTEAWKADARLLLGALSDGSRQYLGTYYLLAIHDNCFSEEQVQRHYQAGPDADSK